MNERTTGLILRTRPLTETSLIVHWLTPDLGRLATVAKGARRPKSPLRGQLDLFYLAEFSFARSRRSELHTLREVRLRETHPVLRQDWRKLQQVSYCAALVEQTTETDTPLPGAFELLLGLVDYLSPHPAEPKAVFAFEMKLLQESGLKPDFSTGRLSEGGKQILQRLLESDWPALARLRLSAVQVTELRQFLHGFLIYHLGRTPGGRNTALQLE